jgi:hypothetical protein
MYHPTFDESLPSGDGHEWAGVDLRSIAFSSESVLKVLFVILN